MQPALLFRKYKRYLFIFLTLLLISLSFIYKDSLKSLGTTLKIPQTLRRLGLVKTSSSGFFKALDSQDLVYDYNGDGNVTEEDYSIYLQSVGATSSSSTTQASSDGAATTAENLYLPSVRGFSSSAYTGSVTVSNPISLPSGHARVTPTVNLAYSSGNVDDLFSGIPTSYRTKYYRQAGTAGLGWNLSVGGAVLRDNNATLNNPDDDKFILSFAGGSANLSKEEQFTGYSTWRTVPNLKTKVVRFEICKSLSTGQSICRFQWQVTTGDGTKYIFGSDPVDNWKMDSDPESSFPQGSGNSWYPLYEVEDQKPLGTRAWLTYEISDSGRTYHALTYKWLLTNVDSVYNNPYAQINYESRLELGNFTTPSGTIAKYTRAVYPQRITYHPHKIEFSREARLDKSISGNSNQKLFGNERINKITVSTKNINDSYKVRKVYKLDYKYGWRPGDHNDDGDGIAESNEIVAEKAIHSLLTSVTQWNKDPDIDSSAKRLPSQSYSYGSNCGAFNGGCPLSSFTSGDPANDTQARTPNDFLLREVDNGYGGRVVYEYWNNGSGGNALKVKYCDEGNNCRTDHRHNTQRHRLASTTTYDGMGNSFRNHFDYSTDVATAYVENHEDFWYQGKNCCNTNYDGTCNNKSTCYCPGETSGGDLYNPNNCKQVGGTQYCNSLCSWRETVVTSCGGRSPCSSWGKQISCVSSDSGCHTLFKCASNCKLRHTAMSGYQFLGYPEVEALTFKKNNSSSPAAKSKTYFHQALETLSCFKPSPLKGLSDKTITYDVNDNTNFDETDTKYLIRLGPMFGSYQEVNDVNLNASCGSYDPETTVSLVKTTQTTNKQVISSTPRLCTKSTTNYDNLDGTKDDYALPHKKINWGQVNCSDFSDNKSDTARKAYTNYTNPNATKWIIPKPKSTWVSDSDSTGNQYKYNHTQYYYDNQPHGSLGNYGQITKTQKRIDGSLISSSTVSYDASFPWLVTKTTDPLGRYTTTQYDNVYRMYPKTITNPKGHTLKTTYDFEEDSDKIFGLPVKVTDANNTTTTTVYDEFGRHKETYLPGKSPGSGVLPNSQSGYFYFNEDDISPCEYSNNCMLGLGKEINGNKIPKMVVSKVTRFSDTGTAGKISVNHNYYNGLGQPIQTRRMWYDEEYANAGIPTDKGKVDILTSQSYNALGNVEVSSNTYTATPFDPTKSKNSFDTRSIKGSSEILYSEIFYDGFGRAIRANYPDATFSRTVHDYNNNPFQTKSINTNCTDADRSTKCSEQITINDAFAQTTRVQTLTQNGKAYSTSFTYHPVLGSLTQTTDTLGTPVNIIEYDKLGRKTKMWDIDMSPSMSGDSSAWKYDYDAKGNLTWQTNPKGVTSQLIYDDLDRVTEKKVGGTTLLKNTYDDGCYFGKGRLCATTSFNLQTGSQLQEVWNTYDFRGQITQVRKEFTNAMPDNSLDFKTFTTSYKYDEGGRLLESTMNPDSSLGIPSETLTYSYSGPYPEGLAGSATYTSGAKYNKDGQLTSFTSGNGTENSFGFKATNNRLDWQALVDTAGEVTHYLDYDYEPLGNIRQITDTVNPVGDAFNLSRNFTYDPLNQLISVSSAFSAGFSYDDIGNITNKNEGGNSSSLVYGNSTSGFYHRPGSANIDGDTLSYSYDDIGNLMSDSAQNYEYDNDNRLIKVQVISTPSPTPTNLPTPTDTPSPTPTTDQIRADANGDGTVDDLDYDIWLANYKKTALNGASDGDFDLNGYVDGIDYVIWLNEYGM